MQNKEQVFLYMKEEIEQLASKEEEKLLQEADNMQQLACAQIREEAKKEIESQLEKELAEITSNESITRSSKQSQRKSDLAKKRDQYVEEVFNAAKEKLVAFTTSKEYKKYIVEHAKRVGETYAMDNVIAYVKEEDMSYKKDIIKAYGKDIEVLASEEITIGGFIIENKAENIVIDESLDFILENQKEWFYRTSGLTIE
ncbi:MAG: V-type ATP synthase subunit E [Coprobacillaceae bacterium]